MIYAKRMDADGCLQKIEKGKRIIVESENGSDAEISGREYACLACALRVYLDHIQPSTLVADDWGVLNG